MPNLDDLVSHLRDGTPVETTTTVSLDAKAVATLRKYQRRTTKANGRPGRLQPLSEVARDLIAIADQAIEAQAGKQPSKRAGKGSSDSRGEPAKS